MDLHLTSEQTLLRDSAAKFIEAAGPKVARGFREQERSFAPARLRQAGELGWLGILVPSAANGLGLGLTELALVLEQAGRGLGLRADRICGDLGGRTGAGAHAASDAGTGDGRRGAGRSGAAGERVWRRSAFAAHASGGEAMARSV